MPQDRKTREYQLTSLMLESRKALIAAYALVFNADPPPKMADREVIRAILDAEFPPESELPTKPR